MKRPVGKCPHCGEQLFSDVGVSPGRKKTAFLEANGKKKHIQDWAAELDVEVYTIYNHLKKNRTMQFIYDRITNKDYKKPGPVPGHTWGKRVKYV